MGYTHYWWRTQELPKAGFRATVDDFRRLLPGLAEAGVLLAGGLGEGTPEIAEDMIVFNGHSDCGHAEVNLGITWPAPGASGVGADSTEAITGNWFAGAQIQTRVCDGDCRHEMFYLPMALEPEAWEKPEAGRYFNFCKTAYKPYDLAVTACLVVAKHHLGDAIIISSDGKDSDWEDARRICQYVLGYGATMHLSNDDERHLQEV